MIVLYTSDLDQPTILNEMRSLSGRDFSEQRHREWYKSGMEYEIVHRILLTLCRSLDLKRLNRLISSSLRVLNACDCCSTPI